MWIRSNICLCYIVKAFSCCQMCVMKRSRQYVRFKTHFKKRKWINIVSVYIMKDRKFLKSLYLQWIEAIPYYRGLPSCWCLGLIFWLNRGKKPDDYKMPHQRRHKQHKAFGFLLVRLFSNTLRRKIYLQYWIVRRFLDFLRRTALEGKYCRRQIDRFWKNLIFNTYWLGQKAGT